MAAEWVIRLRYWGLELRQAHCIILRYERECEVQVGWHIDVDSWNGSSAVGDRRGLFVMSGEYDGWRSLKDVDAGQLLGSH